MFVDQTGFYIILQLDIQDIYDISLDLRIQNRESSLYTPIQVPAHPIGRSQEQLLLTIIIEVPDARMFQKHIHYTSNLDIRTERTVRNQATNPPDNQVDFHPVLACVIQFIDHILVMQSVHLQHDASFTSGLHVLNLPMNHPGQFRHHIEAGDQQMAECRSGQLPFQHRKHFVYIGYQFRIRSQQRHIGIDACRFSLKLPVLK